MRQVGVLGAAGLVALEEMPHRLGEDHANAKFLAAEFAKIPKIQVDPKRVVTNIVVFDITRTEFTAAELSARLKDRGLRMNEAASPRQMRAVTHYDVTRADCATAVGILAEALA